MQKWMLNLKLSKKISFLIVLMVLILFFAELLNRQKVYDMYNQKIDEQNAQILSFYTNYIVTVFERIEATTYAIVEDQNLQKELEFINKNYGELGFSSDLRSANFRIRKYFQKEPYFKSLLLKTDVYQFKYGSFLENEEEINRYLEHGKNAGGSLQTIAEEGRLLAVRELRKLSDLEYVNVGYILGIIDFEEIVKDMRNTYGNEDSREVKIAMYANDICLYSNLEELKYYQKHKDGWYSSGDDIIVVYTSPELGYTMILRNNYKEIQREIRNMHVNSFLISGLVVCLTVMVSSYLIMRMMEQLECIITKMDDYGKGIQLSRENDRNFLERKDEIGRLYRHFYQMADDYKKLTNDYYENERALKEMEFSWMQKQIQPHLLYNTLSAVSWMAYSNEDEETAQMVEMLGKMMRLSTDQKKNVISVDQDLQIAEDYIRIQVTIQHPV